MRMRFKTVSADRVFPVAGVFGSVAVSRRGAITIGWELTFPVAYSVEEGEYDEIVENFASAIKRLPPWSVVHRQDLYTYDTYPDAKGRSYLDTCYNEHHAGRRFLTHRAYVFVSIASRNLLDKAGSSSGLFGISGNITAPSQQDFNRFLAKGNEFISIATMSGKVSARRLEEMDWIGEGQSIGIIQRYMMLGNESPTMSNVELAPDRVSAYDKVAQCYVIGESDALPSEIESVSKVTNLSSIQNTVSLSFGSKLGCLLDCEHVTNHYIMVPPQDDIHAELDRERKKMISGISSTDNRINGAEIGEYLDDVYRFGLVTTKSHVNVIAWDTADRYDDISAQISSALSSMGIAAVYNNYNTPVLYYAGIPSNAFEIGKENLMKMPLKACLAMGAYETYEKNIPNGVIRLCDRMRNIPLYIDTQRVALDRGLVMNYNTFILGGSGTGKSFFTNHYMRNCYDAGENVFIIDVGDSYEGLCGIINEESGGRDGHYLSWDKDHPFSFNPFIGWEDWADENGGLHTDDNGVNFFLSFVQTAWQPDGGWTEYSKTILTQLVVDFLKHLKSKRKSKPIFDDFYKFVDEVIVKKILYKADETNEDGTERRKEDIAKDYKKHGYWCGSIQITKEKFDVEKFVLSIKQYSKSGSYSFLLNDPDPKDLFTSRFTVFEVDKLSQDDKKFYSLCILCIMNAFERKMRGTMEFKNMVIEEAWKAIANETMAPYLAGLWKTARKFNTAAIVVTQEIADIVNSPVIKTAILDNSSIKILLDQSNHINTFGSLMELLSLTEKDKNIILSMNKALNTKYLYREVYINLGGKYGAVFGTEVSPQEACAYESKKDKKEPLLKLAKEIGWRRAINQITGRTPRPDEDYGPVKQQETITEKEYEQAS